MTNVTKPERRRMIERDGREWNRRLQTLAYSFLVACACKKCGSPNPQDYVCMFCESGEGQTDE